MNNRQAEAIYEANKAKGFWDDCENIPGLMAHHSDIFTYEEIQAVKRAFRSQKLMLTVSELAEALEADRKDHFAPASIFEIRRIALLANDDEFKREFENQIKNTYEDELADTYIRLLDQAGGYGVDLEMHVTAKLRYNKLRGHKHGKTY